jgi:hypothetical protein
MDRPQCEEKARLIDEHHPGAASEYERLQSLANEVPIKSTEARIAVNRHIAERGS